MIANLYLYGFNHWIYEFVFYTVMFMLCCYDTNLVIYFYVLVVFFERNCYLYTFVFFYSSDN